MFHLKTNEILVTCSWKCSLIRIHVSSNMRCSKCKMSAISNLNNTYKDLPTNKNVYYFLKKSKNNTVVKFKKIL